MCVMSAELFWTNSTHAFTVITLLHSKQSPWNSVDMSSMNLKVVLTNSAHEFTKFQFAEFQGNFISLLQREFQENARVLMKNSWLELFKNNLKSLANKDKMCGKTVEMVWTYSTHEFKLITLLPS